MMMMDERVTPSIRHQQSEKVVHSSPGQYEKGTSWSKQHSCTVVVGSEMHDLWYWTISV